MAVKAAAEVTVYDQTDATGLVLWYQLTSSAIAPSAPQTTSASATPSGWSVAEPAFNPSQGTRYLYTCLQLVWGDGSCSWGDVQLSSSYEQAKQAWNAANAAQATAEAARTDAFDGINNANESIDDLSGQLEQSASDLNDKVSIVEDDLQGLRDDVEADNAKRDYWLTFDGTNGMNIGASGSEFRTNYTSTDINFMQGDEVLMNLNGTDGVNAPKVTANEVHLGGWMWVSRDNGNLSLKYVG